ncbi:MerR family transcriptional regulator [Parafannyhessea umbonata]|uniref:MerR family transcriptional regulator n=1 Tax=Parafannyhessea umbonata TaxID=604330 RepID=UPI0026EF6084|nr:MerR family transcriptional regulator [Parafannyhessea umbonata]MDD7199374.1 MerR family transcriptional regulator [Parafannyhessea umbonata]MDY4418975.1 MerR family transcriptional regulator [Parafannyhessea umbonata]
MNASERARRCGLYQIGEVSKIGGISQRTLRHYDELGLMQPDLVGDNGYRYYSLQTMLKIPVINYLKMMGLSLEEIASMMQHSSLRQARSLLTKHLEECDEQARLLAEKREAIVEWSELVDEANMVLRAKPKNVNVKYLPRQELLGLQTRFSGSFAESIVSLEFASYVQDIDNAIAGPVILRFPSVEDAVAAAADGSECDVWLLQKPIRPINPNDAFVCPEGMYLSTYHVGAFEELGEAYSRLTEFANDNGYKVAGPAIERFVSDYWTTCNSDLFVAEVLLLTETE